MPRRIDIESGEQQLFPSQLKGLSQKGRFVSFEFFKDALMAELPAEVRLFYVGLWTCSDDWGYLEDTPAQIRLHIAPHSSASSVEMWIDVLVSTGRLQRMVAPGGVRILYIPKFQKNQPINRHTRPTFGWPQVLEMLSRAERGRGMKDAVAELRPFDSYVMLDTPSRRQRNMVRKRYNVEGEPVEILCQECGRRGSLLHVDPLLGDDPHWDGATVAAGVEIVPDPDDDSAALLLCRRCREEVYALPECPPPLRLHGGVQPLPGLSQPVAKKPASLLAANVSGRERTLIFEALVEACDLDTGTLTASKRGALNKAVADLKKVGASPSDVLERGRRFRRQFPRATMTPSALVKHWDHLSQKAARATGAGANASSFEGRRTGVMEDA